MEKKKNILGSALSLVFLLSSALVVSSCNKEHQHNFLEKWESDEKSHWHVCADENCDEKDSLGSHNFVWSTLTEASTHVDKVEKGACTICNYEAKRVIADSGTHTIDNTKWINDETGHWHISTCDKTTPGAHEQIIADFAKHNFGNWEIKAEADIDVNAIEHRLCKVSNFEETRTVENSALHNWRYNYDNENHWEETTCKHDAPIKKDVEAHTWKYVSIDGTSHKQVSTCASYKHKEIEKEPEAHVYEEGGKACKYCGFINVITDKGSFNEIANKTYSGNPQGITESDYTIDEKIKGICEIQYKLSDEADSSYTTTAPTNAGTYNVRIYSKGNASYAKGEIAVSTFNINPYEVTVDKFHDKAYDATVDADASITSIDIQSLKVESPTLKEPALLTLKANKAEYKKLGRHNIPVADLSLGNDNFAISKNITSIVLVNYEKGESSAYANGLDDVIIYNSMNSFSMWSISITKGTFRVGDYIMTSKLDVPLQVLELRVNNLPVPIVTKGDKNVLFEFTRVGLNDTNYKSKFSDRYINKVNVSYLMFRQGAITSSKTATVTLKKNESRYFETILSLPANSKITMRVNTIGDSCYTTGGKNPLTIYDATNDIKISQTAPTDSFVISNTKKVAMEINILVKFTNYTDKEGKLANTFTVLK